MTSREVACLGIGATVGALASTAAQLLTRLILNHPIAYKETP